MYVLFSLLRFYDTLVKYIAGPNINNYLQYLKINFNNIIFHNYLNIMIYFKLYLILENIMKWIKKIYSDIKFEPTNSNKKYVSLSCCDFSKSILLISNLIQYFKQNIKYLKTIQKILYIATFCILILYRKILIKVFIIWYHQKYHKYHTNITTF